MAHLISLVLGLTLSGALLATVGDVCKSNSNCGIQEQCVAEFDQGYCVQFDCSEKKSCPTDAKCMQVPPENFTLCLKKCTKNSDCRAGYRCYEQGVCLPHSS